MRADRLPAITELFNDRSDAKRRAKRLGWLVLPMCPRSGKFGVCHPDYLAAWRQKTNVETRRLAKIAPMRGPNGLANTPWSPIAYGF
jgi:hypothetical protein